MLLACVFDRAGQLMEAQRWEITEQYKAPWKRFFDRAPDPPVYLIALPSLNFHPEKKIEYPADATNGEGVWWRGHGTSKVVKWLGPHCHMGLGVPRRGSQQEDH